MKTTLEIEDPLFRKAKAKAAEDGITLRQFVNSAIAEKLNGKSASEKPWMKSFGALRHMHAENVRIQKLIDEEFKKIDPEEWE